MANLSFWVHVLEDLGYQMFFRGWGGSGEENQNSRDQASSHLFSSSSASRLQAEGLQRTPSFLESAQGFIHLQLKLQPKLPHMSTAQGLCITSCSASQVLIFYHKNAIIWKMGMQARPSQTLPIAAALQALFAGCAIIPVTTQSCSRHAVPSFPSSTLPSCFKGGSIRCVTVLYSTRSRSTANPRDSL